MQYGLALVANQVRDFPSSMVHGKDPSGMDGDALVLVFEAMGINGYFGDPVLEHRTKLRPA